MTLAELDNLVKINKLKVEPPDQKEFDGLVASAKRRLQDAMVEGLSDEGRFSLAYGAAHALSRSLHKSSCRSVVLGAIRGQEAAPAGCTRTSPVVNFRINTKYSFHPVIHAAQQAFRPGFMQLPG